LLYPTSFGKYICHDGNIYEGDWINNKMSGFGKSKTIKAKRNSLILQWEKV
jgi:hypothetical protein